MILSRVLLPLALAIILAGFPRLERWFAGWEGNRTQSTHALAMLLGDSRKLLANHLFVRADVYFHSGYYPTIFDNREAYATPHIGEDAGVMDSANTGDEHVFMGPPRDWIERFGRHFFPSAHTHLGDEHCAHCEEHAHAAHEDAHAHGHAHDHDDTAGNTEEYREMLPWLRMSVAMDPQRIESYLVAAYWLRERMGREQAAEAFLREGIRANPNSHELYFEMGRIALDARGDANRARHLYDVALRKWEQSQTALAEPDFFMLAQILAYRAAADERLGRVDLAIAGLEWAENISGAKGHYRPRLERLRQQQSSAHDPDPPRDDGPAGRSQ